MRFLKHLTLAAAALATLKEITETQLMAEALEKENYIRKKLKHPLITEIRGKGLMLSAMTSSPEITNKVVLDAMHTALDAAGAGSGGTRNISGNRVEIVNLENEISLNITLSSNIFSINSLISESNNLISSLK